MESLERASVPSIRMGEMSIASGGDELRTLLGSCIGLALHDRRNQVGGLAHIVLPTANGKQERPAKFVDTAIPALLKAMGEVSTGRPEITAKLAGGASMFTTTVAATIGRQNVEACKLHLGELGIPIVAEHCGGKKGRRMIFHTGTGEVRIEIVGEDPVSI